MAPNRISVRGFSSLGCRPRFEGRIRRASKGPDLDAALKEWVSVLENPRAWMFPSEDGTPLCRRNWLNRHLRPAAKDCGAGIVNYQMIRRTFTTLIQKHGTIKDAQAQMRHASASLTLSTNMQAIPESVREAVDKMEESLAKLAKGSDTVQ